MSLLENAISLALEIHAGQTDRADRPYILHPLTLMMQMDNEDEQITAVLHDTIEDSDMTIEQLQKRLNLPAHIAEAVDLLSHDKNEMEYDSYIERLCPNPLARKVKLADLRHNMDLTRMDRVQPEDMPRLAKYRRAWQQLADR
jgi:(p)ppGpp synthase/HD superfamily hydrolase